MKATRPGRVIGLALESYSGGDIGYGPGIGRITVFLNPHFAFGSINSDGDFESLFAEIQADGDPLSAETQPTILEKFVSLIKSALEKLGLFIENGIAKVKKLIAENLQIGSPEKPSGITMYDEETGEPYCLKIKSGQIINVPGECTESIAEMENGSSTTEATTTEIESSTTESTTTEMSETGSNPVTTTEATSSEPACVPDWSCADWQPVPETTACGQTFTQTRTCTDQNNCGTDQDKPAETQNTTGTKDCSTGAEAGAADGGGSPPIADTTPPVITLLGDSVININVGVPYVDAGAAASDDVDGDISASIAAVNSVDTNVAGTYTVTYNVSDAAGNVATEVIRTVIVASQSEVVPEPQPEPEPEPQPEPQPES